MKKIFILAALVTLAGSGCKNIAGDIDCGKPNLDGKIHQVARECTKGADIEHFLIKGLTLRQKKGEEGYANFYYNSDNNGKNGVGVLVTIHSDGTVFVRNNRTDGAKRFPKAITGGMTNKTICFEFHNDGGILHFIAWQDNKCHQTYSGTPGSPIIDDKKGGPFKENAKKMYYKFDPSAIATLVLVKGAIFKE